MKASIITKYGGPEVIQFGEIPGPTLTKEKLLIRVKAVSINALDYKIRQGTIRLMTGSKFPKVLGSDFSGVVVKVGQDVKGFQEGDKVYGAIFLFFGSPGALSEYACVAPKWIRKMPQELTFAEAASLPVAALTALNGLRKCGDLNGKTVLVNGATGGVGHFAVQIAKARGAIVTASSRKENFDFAKQLGADEVTDYMQIDQTLSSGTFDVIFDAYAKMNFSAICRLLKKGGIYVSPLFLPTAMISAFYAKIFYGKTLTSSNFRGKSEDFAILEELIRQGKVRPFLDSVVTPEDTRKAFERIETGGIKGKVIVKWED